MKWFVLIFMSFLVFKSFAEEKKSDDKPPVSSFSIDLEALLAPYDYSPEDRRDPFHFLSLEENVIGDDESRTEAQKFSLKEFKVLGIIWHSCPNQSRECLKARQNSRVMLADPKNTIHYLKKGDRIGQRGGYIEIIREGEVVIVEPFQRNNKLFYRSHVLTISDKGTEKK